MSGVGIQPVPAEHVHVEHRPPSAKSSAAVAAITILETQRRRDLADHGRLSLWLLYWSGMAFHYSGLPAKAELFLREYLEALGEFGETGWPH